MPQINKIRRYCVTNNVHWGNVIYCRNYITSISRKCVYISDDIEWALMLAGTMKCIFHPCAAVIDKSLVNLKCESTGRSQQQQLLLASDRLIFHYS